MAINIEHRGFTITFSEDDENWCCDSLNMQDSSLKALKRKIQKYEVATRKVGNGIEVIHLSGWSGNDVKSVTIQTISGESEVWCKMPKGSYRQREKIKVGSLVEKNAANIAVIIEAKNLASEASAMIKKADQLLKDIPRITMQQLREIAGQSLDDSK